MGIFFDVGTEEKAKKSRKHINEICQTKTFIHNQENHQQNDVINLAVQKLFTNSICYMEMTSKIYKELNSIKQFITVQGAKQALLKN